MYMGMANSTHGENLIAFSSLLKGPQRKRPLEKHGCRGHVRPELCTKYLGLNSSGSEYML
jgi:hypothetical protein